MVRARELFKLWRASTISLERLAYRWQTTLKRGVVRITWPIF